MLSEGSETPINLLLMPFWHAEMRKRPYGAYFLY
jgi:hypothetical protein